MELAAARQAADLAKQMVIEGLTEEKEQMQQMLDVAAAREEQMQTQVRRAAICLMRIGCVGIGWEMSHAVYRYCTR